MKWNYPYNVIIFAILCLWSHLSYAQLNSLDGGSAADIATWSQEMTAVPAKIEDGSWEIGSGLIDPNTSHLKLKTGADGSPDRWWRVRSHFDPAVALPEKVQAEVEALAAIKAHGINSIIFTRWSSNSWKSGVRAGRVQGFPLDLREAFERGRGYGRTYGEVAAAFEIENEPDIDYVNENPETYMAFQKAMYLGIHQGAAEAAQAAASAKMEGGRSEIGADSEGGGKVEKRESGKSGIDGKMGRMENGKVGIAPSHLRTFTPFTSSALPLVVMAPLALPPGPFFERLIENGLLSYTDAFNYHYYGYAEDFTGVYEQFRVAVTAAGTAKMEDGRWEIGQAAAPGADGEKVGKFESAKVGTDLRGGLGSVAAEAAKMEDGRWKIGSDFSDANTSHLKPKTPPTQVRRLPVLLTEYGYGSMPFDERYTVPVRVAQWKWHRDVALQIRRLRIAGPMAFYMPRADERAGEDFELTMWPVAPGLASGQVESEKAGASEKVGRWEGGRVGPVDIAPSHLPTFSPLTSASFFVGGLSFTPENFGDSRARPWMWRIGQKIGEKQASPALAWLLDYGEKHPYRPRDWVVAAPEPSLIVIDFIAGKNLNQLKRYSGYLAMNDAHGVPQVEGELVLYNFSNRPVSGRLEKVETWEGGKVGLDLTDPNTSHLKPKTSPPGVAITLAPGERQVIPVSFPLSNDTFVAHTVKWSFVPDEGDAPTSVFSTRFYPDASAMKETVVARFDHLAAASAKNQQLLLRRKLAEEEAFVVPQGRWLVTPGVSVREDHSTWSFTVNKQASRSYWSLRAELPLPDDWSFPDNAVLRLAYRLIVRTAEEKNEQRYFDVYFRTANGNLFQVSPMQLAANEWRTYMEAKDNFTMDFYCRAELPWKFSDNRPVALVFLFRPRVPHAVTYEVAGARVGKLSGKVEKVRK